MEGRFEDYTLGRNISIERVKEIYRLFKKHKFQLAGLSSFGKYITDQDVAMKRALADRLRNDPELLEQTRLEAATKLAEIPEMAKGIKNENNSMIKWAWVAFGLTLVGVIIAQRQRSTQRKGGD
jgi:hypothetical protein